MLGVSDKRADDGLSEAERDRLHRLKAGDTVRSARNLSLSIYLPALLL